MSVAVSNNIDEKSISWNKDSLISKDVAWGVIEGSYTNDENLVLEAGTELHYVLGFYDNSIKANYLKLVDRVTTDEPTLSTDSVHNVSILYDVYYLVDTGDGIGYEIDSFQYFPKYEYEDNFDKDYTIVETRNSNIEKIEVTLINNEDVPVAFKTVGIYMSVVLDEGTVNNVVTETVNQVIGEDFKGRLSCIDILSNHPDPAKVPNGYMYIIR